MSISILDVVNLHVSLRKKPVLRRVSMSCGSGVTALVGANGSGKSTLLRAVLGLVPLTSGTIFVDGIDLRSGLRRARRKMGYLPQGPSFPRSFTAVDALYYAAWLQEMGVNDAQRAVNDIVSSFNLTEVIDRPLESLSGGTRQRVLLGQAVIHKPPLVLLDEPTSGLDLTQQASFRAAISRLSQASTVLLSTHHTDDVELLANRVLVLSQGRLVWRGSVDELESRAGDEVQGGRRLRLESSISALIGARVGGNDGG